jgi:hypothetical protein
MKKILFAAAFIFAIAITASAQDWSEYSRGSDAWHKHNRDALFRPWKYDRGGRLKRGKNSSNQRRSREHVVSRKRKRNR